MVEQDRLMEAQEAATVFIRTVYKYTRTHKIRKMNIKEKMVLYGLVRYPGLKDREICDIIGLKVSTFTAIKSRLQKMDLYKTVRIPNFPQLGYNIFLFVTIKINPRIEPNKRSEFYRIIVNSHPNIFFFFEAGDYASFIGFFKDYSTAKDVLNVVKRAKYLTNTDTSISHVISHMSISRIYNMFDFTGAIIDAFREDLMDTDLESDLKRYLQFDPVVLRRRFGNEPIYLKGFERRVFAGLIKNPDLPDKAIAEKIGVTRQTVARMKRIFLEKNLYFDRKIPNLRNLGLEVLVYVKASLNPKYSLEDRIDGLRYLKSHIPFIFWVGDDLFSTFYCVFRTYDEFARARIDAERYYFNLQYLTEEPIIQPLSIPAFKYIKGFEFDDSVDMIIHDMKSSDKTGQLTF